MTNDLVGMEILLVWTFLIVFVAGSFIAYGALVAIEWRRKQRTAMVKPSGEPIMAEVEIMAPEIEAEITIPRVEVEAEVVVPEVEVAIDIELVDRDEMKRRMQLARERASEN